MSLSPLLLVSILLCSTLIPSLGNDVFLPPALPPPDVRVIEPLRRAFVASEVADEFAPRHRERAAGKRSRLVNLASDWLPEPGESVRADLFPDESVEIVVTRTTPLSGGLFTSGHVKDHPELEAFFASYHGHVSASIRTPAGKRISVSPVVEGARLAHVVAETEDFVCGVTDEGPLVEAEDKVAEEKSAAPMDGGGSHASMAAMLPGAASVVDIMVLYSPQVKAVYGSHAAVQSRIMLMVGHFNETMLNSGCAVVGRLVHTEETSVSEAGNSAADLTWVRTNGAVQTLAATHGADLISYFCSYPGAGRADVTGWHSVTGARPETFTHELGHNFGCHHDFQPGTVPPHPYANGYLFTVASRVWGDIMAYSGNSISLFSSPNLYWQGVSMGTSSHDNVRMINQNASTKAAIRNPAISELQNPRNPTTTSFLVDLVGPTNQAGSYTIEHSIDHATWTTLTTVSFSGGTPITITDTFPATTVRRYYRAKRNGTLIRSYVGFFRKTVPAGDSMVANQFDSRDNRLSSLFPSAPAGTTILKWDAGRQIWMSSTFDFGAWSSPNMSLGPGEGAVFRLAGPTTFVFVGHVWPAFSVPIGLSQNWQIAASAVPQGGAFSVLQFPLLAADGQVSRMTGNGTYTYFTSNGTYWSPNEPSVGLGEAFWVYKPYWAQSNDVINQWSRVFWSW